MRNRWILLLVVGVIAMTALAACGGDSDDADSNPGGITAEQAGDNVKQILVADGCDSPPPTYSSVEADGDVWKLRAAIGLVSFNWTYDPVAGTVVEASGKCTSS